MYYLIHILGKSIKVKFRIQTTQRPLPAAPQGKPKNTGVGILSLLQGIFPAQGSNWSLLHCRQILYQLRYQGSSYNNFWEFLKVILIIHIHIAFFFRLFSM